MWRNEYEKKNKKNGFPNWFRLRKHICFQFRFERTFQHGELMWCLVLNSALQHVLCRTMCNGTRNIWKSKRARPNWYSHSWLRMFNWNRACLYYTPASIDHYQIANATGTEKRVARFTFWMGRFFLDALVYQRKYFNSRPLCFSAFNRGIVRGNVDVWNI